jgi:hypothetical protein
MNIELTVAYVGFGGNIGKGEYFYSYNENVIMVTKADQELNFLFSKETASRFKIVNLVTTDSNNQFQSPVKQAGDRNIKVQDKNTNAQLTFVSVLVEDTVRGVMLSCDPQVLNVPD